MTKFRDYNVECAGLVPRVSLSPLSQRATDTIESVVRALARAEPYNSVREAHDATREDETTDLSTRRP